MPPTRPLPLFAALSATVLKWHEVQTEAARTRAGISRVPKTVIKSSSGSSGGVPAVVSVRTAFFSELEEKPSSLGEILKDGRARGKEEELTGGCRREKYGWALGRRSPAAERRRRIPRAACPASAI